MLFVLPNAGFWENWVLSIIAEYHVLEGRRGVGRHCEEMLGCGEYKVMHTQD